MIELGAADDEDGWHIRTTNGSVERRTSLAAATAALRSSWPAGVAAVALGLLAILALATRRRRAESFATVAIVLASLPMALRDEPSLSAAILAAAVVVPSAWLLRWWQQGIALRLLVVVPAFALAAGWLAARLVGHPLIEELEPGRAAASMVLTIAVLVAGAGVSSTQTIRSMATVRLLDVGVLALVVAGAGIGHIVIGAPVYATAAAVLTGALLYARVRAFAGKVLDQLLWADIRASAVLAAAEQERARIARDLHDAPLQELAGVIRQLEQRPETSRERDALRAVADHLRQIATELHPPVLDDLGLVPALEFLAASAPGGARVEVQLINESGYGANERLRLDVELGIFRIVQEALSNALRHADCRLITITGRVGPRSVSINVTDDGRGVGPNGLDEALRAGRLGLSSMRRRAEAIDARLSHRSQPGKGTDVGIEWLA